MKQLFLLTAVLSCVACAGPAPRDDSQPAKFADSRHCLHDTGSRIKPVEGHCAPAFGYSFSREEIEQAGGASLADALIRLRPL